MMADTFRIERLAIHQQQQVPPTAQHLSGNTFHCEMFTYFCSSNPQSYFIPSFTCVEFRYMRRRRRRVISSLQYVAAVERFTNPKLMDFANKFICERVVVVTSRFIRRRITRCCLSPFAHVHTSALVCVWVPLYCGRHSGRILRVTNVASGIDYNDNKNKLKNEKKCEKLFNVLSSVHLMPTHAHALSSAFTISIFFFTANKTIIPLVRIFSFVYLYEIECRQRVVSYPAGDIGIQQFRLFRFWVFFSLSFHSFQLVVGGTAFYLQLSNCSQTLMWIHCFTVWLTYENWYLSVSKLQMDGREQQQEQREAERVEEREGIEQ